MRLVVVSNRVALPDSSDRAGGLAVALDEALREGSEGLWFGWNGETSRRPSDTVHEQRHGNVSFATVALSREEFAGYYESYANRCLWPLLHFRVDLTAYDEDAERQYRAVNERFARLLAARLRPDDVIWVQDYHLIPLAGALRRLGVSQRIGFFLHVPFPPAALFETLPAHERLAEDFAAYDLAGTQTEADAEHLRGYLAKTLALPVAARSLVHPGRRVLLDAFPIGIDPAGFRALATAEEGEAEFQRLCANLRDRALVVGVDRLDYTKGLVRRMRAFESLLAQFPEARRQVEYLQVAPLSREQVEDYRRFRLELEQLTVKINAQYGETDWTPVHYINRILSRATLAGLYRAASIGLVTPIRDGMNLVAKEYVAAQDADDPGVLVLSRFAGASAQMPEALLVNPYDVASVGRALEQARKMPIEERRDRHAALFAGLCRQDLRGWRQSYLDSLRGLRA